MENKYVKMSDLVDQEIVVEAIGPYKFVAWDNEKKMYVTEDKWFQGASKKYPVTTNKGLVDVGANHVGAMFEGVQHAGEANIIGATFNIKSNGKTGMEIRYFVNAVSMGTRPKPQLEKQPDEVHEVPEEEPIDLDSIPF